LIAFWKSWCLNGVVDESYLFSNGVLGNTMATAFPEKLLLLILWQIKKQYSCWPFDFVCRKNGFYPRPFHYTSKPFFLLAKSMQRLPM